jgi:hypothetical protein
MPATSLATAKKIRRKPRTVSPARRSRRSGPSFAEGMKPFIGMVKNAPSHLSMREGSGH